MIETFQRFHRRHFLATAAAAIALPASHASAQEKPANWPGTRPVSIVIPFPAGVAADVITRAISEQLSTTTGGTFISVHKPGASTTVAARYVVQQPPDGYTILLGSVTTFCLAPWAYKNPGYDPIQDFAPISLLGDAVMVVVSNRWKSLDEFLIAAKRRPGQLSFASGGMGSSTHVMFLDLMARAKIELTHVPYGGSPPALTDTASGVVDVTLAPLVTARPLIDGGRLTVLGVAGESRAAAAPQAPTLSEAGLPGLQSPGWLCLHARVGTPEPIVKAVEVAVITVLSAPGGVAMLEKLSMVPMKLGRAALTQRIAEQSQHYRQLMDRAGIKLE